MSVAFLRKGYYFNERLMRDNYCHSKTETKTETSISHLIDCKCATMALSEGNFNKSQRPRLQASSVTDNTKHEKGS